MTLHLDRFDVLGCDLRGGEVAHRVLLDRKPGSMGSNSPTKVAAAKWKLIEPQPMERKPA